MHRIPIPDRVRPRIHFARDLGFCLLPGVLAVLIIALGRIDAGITDAVYSRRVFPIVTRIIGLPGRFIPFSIVAVLIWSIAPLVLIALFWLIRRLRRSGDRRRTLWRALVIVLFVLSLIFFLFAITCAPNFNRLTLAQLTGLPVRSSTPQELVDLCVELTVRANEAREAAAEDDSGVFTVTEPFSALSQRSLQAFNALVPEYPFLTPCVTAPKAMIGSEALSHMEVTGFYSCFTAEPNVNVHMPALELPFTMCHELAHTGGILREDEANFIGYLACTRSDDPALRYSGLVCALNYAAGKLYGISPDTYRELRSYYHEGIERDLAASGAYWAQYEDKKPAQVYSAVNDTVLKLNSQTDGRQSYGRMVDLLLAEYRVNHSLE